MKIKYKLILLSLAFVYGCKSNYVKESPKEIISNNSNIVSAIIEDKDNFYYTNFSNFNYKDKKLPIGVFDSGIGGLTVMDAIINYDKNNNQTHLSGSDNSPDFEKESFIYFGDQANMPYGNYSETNKVELLKEHIIKDAQFLLSNKYYESADDLVAKTNKKPVKVIVIACNTATAYGKEYIEEFIEKAKLDFKVIGVIDAGARGVLETFQKNEDGIIGVLATVGTVSSKGYPNTILKFKEELSYFGNIEVFSQGGLGIAESVDEDRDYFNKNLTQPREEYKGPSLNGQTKIDKALFRVYNFNFEKSKMLCDSKKLDDCATLQINDAENYVRYHLVSLLEKIRISKTKNKLKAIVLGCTHYPYLTTEINSVLQELYKYKNELGNYAYRDFMNENINLIDPSANTAKELFEYLNNKSLFNPNGTLNSSEFYISVPNKSNKNIQTNKEGSFLYDYKYGRKEGEIQEYIKTVPFSRSNISDDIVSRLHNKIPKIYQLIRVFSNTNKKIEFINDK
ncbi:MAG: Asp/Glu/hydantoin racemase [Bacteroidetes bacterium]|nr:Asp/Glu/hydantoin racemase [Bacteroidota bacterium]